MIDSLISVVLLTLVAIAHVQFQHSFIKVDHLRKQVLQVQEKSITKICKLADKNQAHLSIKHLQILVDPCKTKSKQYRRRYWKISGSLFLLPNHFLSIPLHLWVAPS